MLETIRLASVVTTLIVGFTAVLHGVAQQPPQPKQQSAMYGDTPAWNRVLQISDGRTFVTNGHLALDTEFAKPSKLPEIVIPPSKSIEANFTAPREHECSLDDLKLDRGQGRYVAPSGLWLNADYVDYLRRVLPSSTRLKMQRDLDPIVVVLNGKPIGVLMAMRTPAAKMPKP
jgi:hypothetical protein